VTTVATWSAHDAESLRAALRMTIEGFAERLGVATRTVAKWRAEPAVVISSEIQQALDTLLEQSSDQARERFESLAREVDAERERRDELESRLAAASNLHSALDWLGQLGSADPNTNVLAAALKGTEGRYDAAWRTSSVDRAQVAELLHDYYRSGFDDHRPVLAKWAGGEVRLTILSTANWLCRAADLRNIEGSDPRFVFDREPDSVQLPTSSKWRRAAEARIADCLVNGTRFVDGTLYRMTGWRSDECGVHASFTVGSFAQYALTWDLLETETFKAVQSGEALLPLRDELLPAVADVLRPGLRNCMGGPLALSAFARSGTGSRPVDFALLVQERGARVLNASKRLAVIPKCFHEPTTEPGWDVSVGSSLARELEEELFGRAEVDTTLGDRHAVDPMHPERLTAPMRYLIESDAWTMESTGFGFNLLTGNFEYPSLIAVQDDAFWRRFGGSVETNWESADVRLVSSQDEQALLELVVDPSWSDEGLLAFLLGLRRLKELCPERVALPDIEMGFVN
jgi:hypothetical protein